MHRSCFLLRIAEEVSRFKITVLSGELRVRSQRWNWKKFFRLRVDASAGSINLADFRYFRPRNLYTDARNVRSILVTDFRSELREPVVLISFESLLGRLSVVAYSFAKKRFAVYSARNSSLLVRNLGVRGIPGILRTHRSAWSVIGVSWHSGANFPGWKAGPKTLGNETYYLFFLPWKRVPISLVLPSNRGFHSWYDMRDIRR